MDLSPQMPLSGFVELLRKQQIRRFYFVYDYLQNRVMASHVLLQPLADWLHDDDRDFAQHEGIFCQVSSRFDHIYGAFVHKTVRGQAQGGTRFWSYPTVEAYFRDGLRLALGMTRKNALAGLWWGGGKGVIARDPHFDPTDPEARQFTFQEYGSFITSLRGCYVTAEDVGTNTEDMGHIFSRTRFVTCIPEALGGSGNPSIATARGVICGMEAAEQFLDGEDLRGKVVAIQGVGHVGSALMDFLLERGVARIIATDINANLIAENKQKFAGKPVELRLVDPGDWSIVAEPCDIFAPCATGAILNEKTIPQLRARIVCGAANNQLEDPLADDRRLFERGILYVPDFLVNRMGIVHCANEQYGYVEPDSMIERHLGRDWEHSIYQSTLRVLHTSRLEQKPPGAVAVELADRLADEPHPIFGHRGRKIIESLVQHKWEATE